MARLVTGTACRDFSVVLTGGHGCRRIGWGRFVGQMLASNGAMVLVLCGLLHVWQDWSAYSWNLRVGYLAVMCSAGMLVYFVVLLVMGLRPKHLRLQA